MDPIYYYLFGGTIVLSIALIIYLRFRGRKELLEEQQELQQQVIHQPARVGTSSNPDMVRLQLQAYERLSILCERMGLTNLLGKFPVNELSATQLQSAMVQNIKTEFEYNVSQQLYVSPAAWDGMKNVKDQNIFIINQLSSLLPPNANGMDLSKKIVELISQDENATLNNIVAALLNKEAKQLMS